MIPTKYFYHSHQISNLRILHPCFPSLNSYTHSYQWHLTSPNLNFKISALPVRSKALFSYHRIHFENASKCHEILNRGPWLFKDDWLALAPFDPTLNAQDHTFNAMNVWVRIQDIPSVLMESDSMAIQTRSSLGSLIGIVTKTDTRRIDGAKMVNTGKDVIEESGHSSDEALAAIAANQSSQPTR
ncbi:hypothetical protein V6N11_068326 [Hibiscus sabdariffa]|uniref:DUF4283 domain-containing protein n=2 Tax=Hibiscus sabdariffa TaxID=183260 RepID=A0ABR2B6D6_9ROSI